MLNDLSRRSPDTNNSATRFTRLLGAIKCLFFSVKVDIYVFMDHIKLGSVIVWKFKQIRHYVVPNQLASL